MVTEKNEEPVGERIIDPGRPEDKGERSTSTSPALRIRRDLQEIAQIRNRLNTYTRGSRK